MCWVFAFYFTGKQHFYFLKSGISFLFFNAGDSIKKDFSCTMLTTEVNGDLQIY